MRKWRMTIEDAIYCLMSYQPGGEDKCLKCKYYGTVQLGKNIFTCRSIEARELAINVLREKLREEQT